MKSKPTVEQLLLEHEKYLKFLNGEQLTRDAIYNELSIIKTNIINTPCTSLNNVGSKLKLLKSDLCDLLGDNSPEIQILHDVIFYIEKLI